MREEYEKDKYKSLPSESNELHPSYPTFKVVGKPLTTEHISNGDKLGIVDRFCRILRELLNRYYEITCHESDNLKNVAQSAIDIYNDNTHRTIKTIPNNAWADSKLQITKHLNDMIQNESIYKSVPFNEDQQEYYKTKIINLDKENINFQMIYVK